MNLPTTQPKTKRGFTLIELLVVISIVSLLISILLPALKKARESSRKIQCGSSIRQIGMLLTTYCQDNREWMPTAWTWWRDDVPDIWYGYQLHAKKGLGQYVNTNLFISCPSEPTRTSKYFGMNEVLGAGALGKGATPQPPSTRLIDILKPSNTMSFIDGHPTKDSWLARPLTYPMGGTFATQRRYGWERHNQAPNMVHVDGHVTNHPYEEIDIYSWSDPSVKFWRYK